jgi:phospho-N-acetylmuramoyl-pentapeptide-transferase
MIPWLFGNMEKEFTLRAALAGVTALLASLALGPRVIAWLRARKVGENTQKNDSKQLDRMMHGKSGTPTMGGVFIVAAILLSLALFGNFRSAALWLLVGVVAALASVGAADDWLKLSGRCKTGMRMRTKLFLQVAVGLAAGAGLWLHFRRAEPEVASLVAIPFLRSLDLGAAYPLFVALVVVAATNAVNITDGLDGLAGGCLSISTFAYAVVAYIVGRTDFAAHLQIAHVGAASEVAVFCTAMLGATVGFLWFNSHPAQVFMGDSGSLPLGGALGLVACAVKQELLLVLIGGVFVIEAGSSLLQILSFKATGKRVFRIAPLHHHFQFQGLPETKITLRFWIVGAVMAVASLSLLKLK